MDPWGPSPVLQRGGDGHGDPYWLDRQDAMWPAGTPGGVLRHPRFTKKGLLWVVMQLWISGLCSVHCA